ncbi:MAG: sugar ABC transporter permease [Microbacterium sp.]
MSLLSGSQRGVDQPDPPSATRTIVLGNRRPKSGQRYSRYDAVAAWTLLAPALVLFTIFIVVPTVAALALSLFEWHFFDTPQWVGLENFARLIGDPDTWSSLGVTFEFVILGVIPTILIGFMIAVLVNVNLPGVGVLRVLFFVPVVVSVAVSGVIWAFLYDPRAGPIGAVFRVFGWTMPDLLNSQLWATPSLVVMMIWGGLPIVVILYLAGLQRISPDIYAAAALDGAGPWRTLWSITWPNVGSTTLVVVVLQIIGFVSGSLDLALIMTNGGPLGATRALGLYAYQQAFAFQDVGYATALSVLQLVVIVGIVSIGQFVIRRMNR